MIRGNTIQPQASPYGNGSTYHQDSLELDFGEFDEQSQLISPLYHPTFNTLAKEWDEYSWSMFLLGKATSMIAHDLNNILTSIRGNLELATIQSSHTTHTEKHIRQALQATNRAQELVKEFQTCQISERLSYQPQLIDIQAVVTEALTLIHPTIPSGITIRKSDEGPSQFIQGNALQILRAISNLLSNAVLAMNAQATGELFIEVYEQKTAAPDTPPQDPRAYVCVSIEDTGPGIAPNVCQHMFEPFFTTRKNGTGLGLPIVKEIIQNHGGHLVMESELGKGSKFCVMLPPFVQPS